jgi:hypothetical protein
MYKLIFYVPASHVETVKNALFEEGAGQYQGYDQCCWQVAGEGQFRTLPGSQPFVGEPGNLQKITEYKVEMICAAPYIKKVLHTLLTVHPYQQPAYQVFKFLTAEDL